MFQKRKRISKRLITAFALLTAVMVVAFSSTAYAATTVTVKFIANGGTVSTTSKRVTYGKTYGTLPTPTRVGHSFAGWYTASSGGTKVTASTKVSKTATHSLYAHWNANTYTITFNGNGSTVSPSSKRVVFGNTYGTLPSPTKYGYNFAGWYTASSGGTRVYASTTMNKASNHTLYAQWTPITRTLVFNANGGSVSTASKTITYGKTLGNLPTPTRSGYTFAGWSRTKSGSTDYVNANTTFNSTNGFTVYARWNKKVAFDANGGSSVGSRNYLEGTKYGSFPTTSRAGYRFLGWYTKKSSRARVFETDNVSSVGTLYAEWEKVDGAFSVKACTSHSAASHKATFTANDATVKGLRSVVLSMADSRQKYAALYALDAVGSYYCQDRRNTSGAYDCSSLVDRAYVYSGYTSLFTTLPDTWGMQSKLDTWVNEGKATTVTNGEYKTGDIMFSSGSGHVSIYIGTYNGVQYRIAAEEHAQGVGYFNIKGKTFNAVYRLK